MDQEIFEETWNGAIPVVLNLHEYDSVKESPPPYYLMLERTQYLHTAFREAIEYFSEGTSFCFDDFWFESGPTPLRAHLPAGVLFDLHGVDQDLPWSLTVRCSDYAKGLQRFPTLDSVKAHFINSCKEAAFLRYGSAQRVFGLSVPMQDALWRGMAEHQLAEFGGAATHLLPKDPSDLLEDPARRTFLPIRVVRREGPTLQRPLTPMTPRGPRTLGDLADEYFPGRRAEESQNHEFVVHGVCPPFETPLMWMCQYLIHPDTFLYIAFLECPRAAVAAAAAAVAANKS